MSKPEDGQDVNLRESRLKTLTLPRPRCLRCKNVVLKKYRSIRDQGDGSALSWVRCANCGERFKVLLE